jgi:DNA polymerase-3 subunit epsilon
MDFVVIDVETANPDSSSICQVGIASFRDGALVDTWVSLVNPEDEFNAIQVSIHGIHEEQVQGAPNWASVHSHVASRLGNQIVVCHMPFDRLAVGRACDRSGLAIDSCRWLDSAQVVRRAWPQFSKSGYGLTKIAKHLGIDYGAHDALEDAKCAGEVVLRAIAETGLSLEEWLVRVEQPVDLSAIGSQKQEGKPEGVLCNEVLVFTGALSISRHEAADAAAAAGCQVDHDVTKQTTLLVVGDQDLRKLNGREKSSKHLKAEHLIAKGQDIRILGESDFKRIVLRSSAAKA